MFCCQDEAQEAAVDLPVLLKIQRRLKELEQENQCLQQQLDEKDEAQQAKAIVCNKHMDDSS